MSRLCTKFGDDLKRKEFLPLKVLNLVVYGGLLTLYPFLTIHARSIGISERQFGTISGILPFICLFVPAAAGMLADKIGNFKWFVSITLALNGLTGLLFLSIPRMEHVIVNQKVPIQLRCTLVGNTAVLTETPSCQFSNNEFQILLQNCIFDCDRITPELDIRGTGDWCGITNKCISNFAYESYSIKESHTLAGKINTEGYNATSNSGFVETDFCPDVTKIEALGGIGSPRFDACHLSCFGSVSKFEACNSDDVGTHSSDLAILVLYTAIRICNSVLKSSSFPLLEAAIVAILKEKKGDLGFQRVFSNIGIIIITPLSGALIDHYSTDEVANFSPAFYLYCGLNCLGAIIIVLSVDLKFKPPSTTVVKDLKKLMKNTQVILLLIVCLIVGIALGVIDTFLFWLLEDLGADKSLMGITVTVGASFGVPFLFYSTQILDRFGCANCITLGVAVFIVRLLGYALIPTAWWAMPFEALECFTTSLFQVAVITYAAILATPSTIATLQGILSGTLHGVGRGMGSLIGGFLLAAIGVRNSFLVISLVCAVTSVSYATANKLLVGASANVKSMSQNGHAGKVNIDNNTNDSPKLDELDDSKV